MLDLAGNRSRYANEYFDNVGPDIWEKLAFEFLKAEIGQRPSCRVVLVGHSIGGLMIKQLCLQAHKQLQMSQGSEATMLGKFSDNLKGIFYYSTPHNGFDPVVYKLAHRIQHLFFKILSTEVGRLRSGFDTLRAAYREWHIAGLGESRTTKRVLMQKSDPGLFDALIAHCSQSTHQLKLSEFVPF